MNKDEKEIKPVKKNTKSEDNTNLDKPYALLHKAYTIPKKDIVSPSDNYDENKNKDNVGKYNYDNLKEVVRQNADDIEDVDGTLRLLPDLALVGEVLCSSVLSPKEMCKPKLAFIANKTAPTTFTEIMREYFTTECNIEADLYKILHTSLFKIGAEAVAILPVCGIRRVLYDNVVGLESNVILKNGVRRFDIASLPNVGILKTDSNEHYTYACEGMYAKDKRSTPVDVDTKVIQLTDNTVCLTYPEYRRETAKRSLRSAMYNAYGVEVFKPPKSLDLSDDVLRLNNGKSNPADGSIKSNSKDILVYPKTKTIKDIVEVTFENDDKSTDKLAPIIINLPKESVIPVFTTGNKMDRVGAWVVLDENGAPLSFDKNYNGYKDLSKKLQRAIDDSVTSKVFSTSFSDAYNAQQGDMSTDIIHSKYNELLEKDLKDSIKNGAYGDSVEINAPEDFYKIMLYRQLKKQHTKVLFIPDDFLSYIAFDYDAYGRGVSLLEKTKLYSSLRAVLMFATIMGLIKNSVSGRKLNITLSDNDADPLKTIEEVITMYMAMDTRSLPLGRINPVDIVDGLQRGATQIKVNGGTVLPGTDLDIEEHTRGMQTPDTGVMDELKKQQYSGLLVTPELITQIEDGDFASTSGNRSLLHAKRVSNIQDQFCTQIGERVKKITRYTPELIDSLKKSLSDDGQSEDLVYEYVESITVTLPKPDATLIEAKIESIKKYYELIDLFMPLIVSDDQISSFLKGQNITGNGDTLKNAIRNVVVTNWVKVEGLLPEFDDILSKDGTIGDEVADHEDKVISLIEKIFITIKKREAEADEKITKLDADLAPPPPPASTDTPPVDNVDTNTPIADDGSTDNVVDITKSTNATPDATDTPDDVKTEGDAAIDV